MLFDELLQRAYRLTNPLGDKRSFRCRGGILGE